MLSRYISDWSALSPTLTDLPVNYSGLHKHTPSVYPFLGSMLHFNKYKNSKILHTSALKISKKLRINSFETIYTESVLF